MKFGNSSIDSNYVFLIYDVTPHKIAKLHKGAYSAHHLRRNMTCNGRKINLQSLVGTTVKIASILLYTFISAFESSPVHCLNPRPSGKQRRAGNEGAAAMLMMDESWLNKINRQWEDLPPVNVSENLFSLSWRVLELDIICHPGHQVIFECSFNNLVEEVWW